jgi:hypothetical protein
VMNSTMKSCFASGRSEMWKTLQNRIELGPERSLYTRVFGWQHDEELAVEFDSASDCASSS